MEAEAQLAESLQASSEGGELPRGCAELSVLPKVNHYLLPPLSVGLGACGQDLGRGRSSAVTVDDHSASLPC